jgi:excisionase family DNA binding protein
VDNSSAEDGREKIMGDGVARIGGRMNLEDLPDLASKWEVASYLGVSWRTVDRLRKRGELKTIHVESRPKITKESVVAYVERQRNASNEDDAENA